MAHIPNAGQAAQLATLQATAAAAGVTFAAAVAAEKAAKDAWNNANRAVVQYQDFINGLSFSLQFGIHTNGENVTP